jgi:hypothetical protein
MPTSTILSDNGVVSGTTGLKTAGGDDGTLILQTTTAGGTATTAMTINTTQQVAFTAGTAAAPSITPSGDPNTGIFFPAADTIAFGEGGAEVMRIDSSGQVAIGTTTANDTLTVGGNNAFIRIDRTANEPGIDMRVGGSSTNRGVIAVTTGGAMYFTSGGSTERARFDSSGNFLVKTTSIDVGDVGCELRQSGLGAFTTSADVCVEVNRLVNDGTLINFRQDSTTEGTISVSGSTVSYNGGHLSRWAQMLTKPDLLKGTVMSNLDEMNVYIAPTTYWTEEDELPEGVNVGDVKVETHEVQNEQLNKVKVSDVEGDVNVAGVFVNWDYDDAHQVEEINMAMTGDMIIRIAQGVVVQKGDLLMSAGDGTAKPQGDDIVRSKTVAKVTSNHVTCTYADGSYCVPCVLMAC